MHIPKGDWSVSGTRIGDATEIAKIPKSSRTYSEAKVHVARVRALIQLVEISNILRNLFVMDQSDRLEPIEALTLD